MELSLFENENGNEPQNPAFLVGAVISRFSIEERFRIEEKLVKMVTDKRPYYKTVKKREVVRDTVSDLLDAIIQNGL
jgi:hypothetical protein